MKPIVNVENLSKQYRLGTIGTGTIRDDVQRWLHRLQGKEDPFLKVGDFNDRASKGNSEYVWALKDINFAVMPGEVLGIIGKNGAGKSTLLKILSKVTGPTTGRIDFDGRIGSLLEVGTGFHPELTGRENIFLNGAILGMRKHEIRSKLDQIIDFSGCERYIDTPVKRYSSGMTIRLGFAVAAHLDPEILIVDEVLAVGDAEFQKKAIGKMQDVSRNEGRTVLFVSHNMAAVKNLCTKGLVLDKGMVSFEGKTVEAIDYYFSIQGSKGATIIEKMSTLHPGLSISDICVNGSSSDCIHISGQSASLEVSIKGFLTEPLPLCFEAVFVDENDIPFAIYNPDFSFGTLKTIPVGTFEIRKIMHLPTRMNKGRFYINFLFVEPLIQLFMAIPRGLTVECEGFVNDSGYNYSFRDGGLINLSYCAG
ncbi:ABC transporter ATP-binding protein [Spirosoma validum]|uniref:ABC transporter ATP-binding protein n=1 Tax=Spirosoma validum TaxID=2771355 RepID=A0A927AZD4_9BACT|nr:ABC transporter ATP-binding protein [Spirosoma validum]MBD2752564.1 ABC transporter ATP-binding protein [Spirosoma validum]